MTGPAPSEHPAAEHLTPDRMNRYAFRTLDVEALLAADDHLAACPECRGRMVDEAGLAATVRSLGREVGAARRPEPDHLAYEAVEALAEERLRGAAREVAELHVEGCATCAGEVADLRAFVAAHREARRAAAAAAAAGHMGGPATDAGRGAGETPMAARAAAGRTATAGAAAGRGAIAAGSGAGAAAGAAVAAEAGAGTDGAPGSPLTIPYSRPRRAGAPIVAAVAITLLVGAGAGHLATRHLHRERDAMAMRVQELTRQNESLAARADEAARSRADLERQAAAAAQAARPAPVTLNDRRGRDAAIAVGLDDDGQLVGLDTLVLADARAVAGALRRGAVEIPAEVLALVRDEGGTAPGPVLIAPVGVAIRGTRPTFAWRHQEGATGYALEVLEESGAVAMRGGPTRSAKWTPPRTLRRGATYAWSVAAMLPGDPAEAAATGGAEGSAGGAEGAAGAGGGAETAAEPARALSAVSARGRFRVLDAAAAAALERALRAASGSRLAAGVFYARAGLLDEAIAEMRALAAANPDSDLARSLLASVETAHTAR